jgi:hypothetical protein
MTARSIEEEGDQPVLCSSQVDSLRTVLSIRKGLYTSLLFVHMWLDQQVNKSVIGKCSMCHGLCAMVHALMASYLVCAPGLCANDVIPQSMVQ